MPPTRLLCGAVNWRRLVRRDLVPVPRQPAIATVAIEIDVEDMVPDNFETVIAIAALVERKLGKTDA